MFYVPALPFTPTGMERITAIAYGRVQGVGYRYYVSGCARGTGVDGYVKNLPDGSVMVVAEGSREALDAFTGLIRAPGDMVISVRDLVVTPGEATGEFRGFGVRW
jgi:acylphosphatase